MKPERWQLIKQVAEEAESISKNEREQWLVDRCGDDRELYDEALRLMHTVDEPTTHASPLRNIASAAAHEDWSGKQLNSWRLVREIGSGGMGSVWLAERADAEFRMRAAVKLIKGFNFNTTMIERFRQERQILADLQHPNICALMDGGTTDEGLPFLVMEFVEGETLDEWRRHREPAIDEILLLIHQLCLAVNYAHEMGILHRDIKPQNIMVTPDGYLKLMDFGIADHSLSPKAQDMGKSPMTPEYAAPEQLQGKDASIASDIYSMGLVLLFLVSGKRPRDQDSDPLVNWQNTAQMPAYAWLTEIMQQVLAQDSDQRPSSMTALIQMFRAGNQETEDSRSHDVLFWYPRSSRKQVEPLVRRLADETDLSIWLDIWNLIPGDDEQLAWERAVQGSRCIVMVVDEHVPSADDLSFRVLQEVWERQQQRVIPLLLPGRRRPKNESSLPQILKRRTWAKLHEQLYHRELDKLARAIRGLPPGRSEVGDYEDTCPFRGLASFREEDEDFFYGREAITQRLREHLMRHNFLAVLGPSGSGKSSIVFAGLVPWLRDSGYEIVHFHPTDAPLKAMTHALFQTTDKELVEDLSIDPTRLYGRLRSSRKQGARIMLVIDQFEEIFTLTEDRTEVDHFLNGLLYALAKPDDLVSVVLTMRSDFLGQCTRWPDLDDYITERMIQIKPMSRHELEQAIIEPALLTGLQYEDGLEGRILDELEGAAAELPLLGHALMELYERRDGNLLTLAAYDDIGGILGALTRRAEQEFLALDEVDQHTLQKMFTLYLIHPGEGVEDTRRRASRSELLETGNDPKRAEKILERFVNARLLMIEGEKAEVDVAHEALIRQWPRIRHWMSEDRETARLLRQLHSLTTNWEESDWNVDRLLRGGHLQQMRELSEKENANLGASERSFIEASVLENDLQDRLRERRKNLALVAAFIGVCLAVVALVFYYMARSSSEMMEIGYQTAQENFEAAIKSIEESNYSLALMYTENARTALEDGRPSDAWIYGFAALTKEIPENRDLLPTFGLFADPRMANVENILWRSSTGGQGQVALSPDKKRLAIGRKHLIVYDLETGKMVAHEAELGYISEILFTPDSRGVMCLSTEFISLVSANNGRVFEPKQIPLNRNFTDTSLSPDGSKIAILDNTQVHIIDVQTGAKLWQFSKTHEALTTVCFASNNQILLSSIDGKFQVWSQTGLVLDDYVAHGIWMMASTPEFTCVYSMNGDVSVWTGGKSFRIIGKVDKLNYMFHDRQGNLIATRERRAIFRIGKNEGRFSISKIEYEEPGFQYGIFNSVDVANDLMVLSPLLGTVAIFQIQGKRAKPILEIGAHRGKPGGIVHLAKLKTYVSLSYGKLKAWHETTGKTSGIFEIGHTKLQMSAVDEKNLIIVGDPTGKISVLGLEQAGPDRIKFKLLSEHQIQVKENYKIKSHKNGLVTVSTANEAYLLPLAELIAGPEQDAPDFKFEEEVRDISYLHRDDLLMFSFPESVSFYSSDGERRRDIDPEGLVSCSAISASGKLMALGMESGMVRLYSTSDHQSKPLKLLNLDSNIKQLVFCNDSKLIITTSKNRSHIFQKNKSSDTWKLVYNLSIYGSERLLDCHSSDGGLISLQSSSLNFLASDNKQRESEFPISLGNTLALEVVHGDELLALSREGIICGYDLSTKAELYRLDTKVEISNYHISGNKLSLLARESNKVKIFELGKRAVPRLIHDIRTPAHENYFSFISYDEAKDLIFTGCGQSGLKTSKTEGFTIGKGPLFDRKTTVIDHSPKLGIIAAMFDDNLEIWETENFTLRFSMPLTARDLAIHEELGAVYYCDYNSYGFVDLDNFKHESFAIFTGLDARDIYLGEDPKLFATTTNDDLFLWEIGQTTPFAKFPKPEGSHTTRVTFVPQQTQILVSHGGGRIREFNYRVPLFLSKRRKDKQYFQEMLHRSLIYFNKHFENMTELKSSYACFPPVMSPIGDYELPGEKGLKPVRGPRPEAIPLIDWLNQGL